MPYQSMLAFAKKTNYIAYDTGTCMCHFLNGIMNPSLTQTNLLLDTNHNQFSGTFDATIEYLMNQVTHQQGNQHLNFDHVNSGANKSLKTKGDQGHNLEMPVINYSPEVWTQLSSANSSLCKYCTQSSNCKCQHTNC